MATLLWCPNCRRAYRIVSGDRTTNCRRCRIPLEDPPASVAVVLSTALETPCTITSDDRDFLKSIRVSW